MLNETATPESDPRRWRLQGSNDCNHWQTVDRQTNQVFNYRQQTRVFAIRSNAPFSCYRFEFEAKRGAKVMQVAELDYIASSRAARSPHWPWAAA